MVALSNPNESGWYQVNLFTSRDTTTAFELFLNVFSPPINVLHPTKSGLRRGAKLEHLIFELGQIIDHVNGISKLKGYAVLPGSEVPHVVGMAEVEVQRGQIARFVASPLERPNFFQQGLFVNEDVAVYASLIDVVLSTGLRFSNEERDRVLGLMDER